MPAMDSSYHLGHLLLECFEANPERISQIDAATGEKETNRSVLARVKRLVACFRKLGLQPGDVLALSGRNHLDLHIPYYAALMCGLPIAAMDPLCKYGEILGMLRITEPKIAFCQKETHDFFHRAAKELGLSTVIVDFDGDCNFKSFMDTNDVGCDGKEFRPTDFDGSQVFAWLTPTSGTTGAQKFAAFNHLQLRDICLRFKTAFIDPGQSGDMSNHTSWLHLSTVQWISSYFNALIFPLYGITKVQTSDPVTPDHLVEIITTYRPESMLMTPWSATEVMNHPSNCDLSCLRIITLAGSRVPKDIVLKLRARVDPKCTVNERYGQTETLGLSLLSAPEGPLGNCGKPFPPGFINIKLVDPETKEVITEPNKPGELWHKGPTFVEYYRMPEATAKAFSPDGWYKTGDLLYRDEDNYYYFYERLKMLIKYKNYQVAPDELEEVISTHPAVDQVAVTSIEDTSCGELPVACVVLKPGATVSAVDIQDLVANKLSEMKHLHGGVIFMDALPTTSSGKLARAQLREIVNKEKRRDQ